MDTNTLLKILSQGEGETVEFKSSFDKESVESLVAFASSKGGMLFVGVNNKGDIIGTKTGDETVQNWINRIKQDSSPSIIPDVGIVHFESKEVVVFSIDEFPIKPVAFKNRYFKRVSNSNQLLTITEIANLHLQSLQLSWDSYPNHDAILKDLDEIKIEHFIHKVNEGGRFHLENKWQNALEKLSLLKNGQPTNGAMLLFGKKAPQYNIHIGRFKTPYTIIDDRMINSTLFEAVEESMRYIISHIKVAFEFTGDIQRNEIFEYPLAALRELLLNSVVHRDYTSPIDIQIKIFDDSITFFNPGKLYGDLTIEQLKSDHYQSRTRNKLIAESFYLTKDIEKYGSGYIRVRREISEYPSMKFEYEESGDGYLVSLNYQTQKTSSTEVNGGVSGGVNELLELIRSTPGRKSSDFRKALGQPQRTIERWLKQLKDTEKIEFRGAPKTGGYFVRLDNS
jgi:ATP-dependent DNA helicase RecG